MNPIKSVLPLNDVVNVIINLSPRSAVRAGFNLSMLLSDSNVLSIDNRVPVFSSLASMEDIGFNSSMPEYKAAQIYFAGRSRPSRVAIGYWDSANETLAEAIAACRLANREWYGVCPIGKTNSTGTNTGTGSNTGTNNNSNFEIPSSTDILDAATLVEALMPSTVMFTAVDLATMANLKRMSLRRTLGVVTEDILKPVGILGWAMGANTGLVNSAYTLKFKQIVGVPVDSLSEAQVSDAKAVFGNVYINRGATYDWFEDGTMADGTWFDEMINLDMLANYIQLSICDLLNKTTKVPQTEAGVLQIINAFIPDLEMAVKTGFATPGIWTAPSFLTLEQGDAIENGYLVLSESIDDQSIADREARLAPPIYIALKLAGAIHSVVVQVNVNR